MNHHRRLAKVFAAVRLQCLATVVMVPEDETPLDFLKSVYGAPQVKEWKSEDELDEQKALLRSDLLELYHTYGVAEEAFQPKFLSFLLQLGFSMQAILGWEFANKKRETHDLEDEVLRIELLREKAEKKAAKQKPKAGKKKSKDDEDEEPDEAEEKPKKKTKKAPAKKKPANKSPKKKKAK